MSSSCRISENVTWYFSILHLQQRKLVNYLWNLLLFKARNLGEVLTMPKSFTAYSSLVAKILNFVVKFFFVYLVSMMESWGKDISFNSVKNEKRKKSSNITWLYMWRSEGKRWQQKIVLEIMLYCLKLAISMIHQVSNVSISV